MHGNGKVEDKISKVSIVVPVYNVEKYLERCLDSIVNQTYKNLEIICVNDGSTDNSLKILKNYAKKDERIRVINRKNGGLSAARNSGLDNATGKYCYFVDSDDWIELYTIGKLVKIITTYDVDVVVHSVENIPEDDSCIEMAQNCQDWINNYRKPDGIYDIPIDINKKLLPVAWNKLYKIDIMNKFRCRFPKGLISEDELFVWEYGIHCKNYYYLDEKLYNYFRRADSIMGTRDNSPKSLDMLEIQKKIYEVVKKYKNIEDYREYLTCNYIGTVEGIFSRIPNKYRNEALKRVKDFYETVIHDKRILKIYRREKYKYLISFLQNIFSVKNVRKGNCVRKQVKLLGIKVKFKDKCKTLFNTCSELQNTCNELRDRMNVMNIKVRYLEYQKKREIVLEKLRKEKRKLRVCFLVSENEKWNAQTLYDAMEKSEDFYPFVVVTEKSDATRSLQHHIKFFKNCCKNVEIGFDEQTNISIDLKQFKPDIVFYQQLWILSANQSPVHMLDCALSYYFSYSIGDVPTNLQKHPKDFYPALQKYFVFSEEEKRQYINTCGCADLINFSITGHPKLDVYNNYEEKNFSKKHVIYAPHHSIEDFSLHYGTFDWNGKYVLEWAKSHPELNWVFKPHPQFKQAVLRKGLMTSNEIEKYYQDWADLGIYYDDGNYFDLFKNSKCLITDCGSFLTEYFPTKNPVIHLRNPKGTDYSATNKIIMQTYYDTWDIVQLRAYLDDILLNGNDPKREERVSLLKKLKIGQDSSTDKIIRELKKDMGRF